MAGASALTASVSAFSDRFPSATRVCVAYSGGRDSHVLLSVAAQVFGASELQLDAVHVNHGLQAEADTWALHCREVCEALGVPLQVESCDGVSSQGGPEAAARAARYAVFDRLVGPSTVLLQAHHADDQAETVLLRLLRGCGVHGAAGMPAVRVLGEGLLWRPFLGMSSDTLSGYASALGLRWVEDPSNADTRFDRNFVRREIMPKLRERWPATADSLATSAANFADAAQTLDRRLDTDFEAEDEHTLRCDLLHAVNRAEQRLLLHRWFRRCGLASPARNGVNRVLDEVVGADSQANPRIQFGQWTLRRHREVLYLVPVQAEIPADWQADWPVPHVPLNLPAGRVLTLEDVMRDDLAACWQDCKWTVRFRRGGEEFKPFGRPAATLKKQLNAAGIPPWERSNMPLLYIDGELAWVSGLGVGARFHSNQGRNA